MSQAVNRYNVLYESLLSRSRRVELPRGLDTIAAWSSMRVRNRGVTRATLLARAQRVDALAREMRNHSDGALDASLGEVREVFVRRRHDGRAVERALAMTREVARRETGEEPFAVQLAGALALHSGCIVEMLTGEGKTLTGSVVAPLIAWEHRRLHVFTVNDYLARRDAKSREAIYKRCGVSVGAIQHEQEPGERFEVYSRGIVYGTPKQITADWLRDQIRLGSVRDAWTARAGAAKRGGTGGGPMVPGLHAALIDEADAVLIDEGVVPLIIARSRREDELSGVYRRACEVAAKLDEGPDYEVDHLRKKAELKRRGVDRVALMLADAPEAIFRATRRAEELVRQALVALGGRGDGQVRVGQVEPLARGDRPAVGHAAEQLFAVADDREHAHSAVVDEHPVPGVHLDRDGGVVAGDHRERPGHALREPAPHERVLPGLEHDPRAVGRGHLAHADLGAGQVAQDRQGHGLLLADAPDHRQTPGVVVDRSVGEVEPEQRRAVLDQLGEHARVVARGAERGEDLGERPRGAAWAGIVVGVACHRGGHQCSGAHSSAN